MARISKDDRLSEIIRILHQAYEGNFLPRAEVTGQKDDIDFLADAVNGLLQDAQQRVGDCQRMKAALLEAFDRFRRLEANIPGMVYRYALYPDGRFSFPYVDDASRDLFDVDPADAMKNPAAIAGLIHPDDRQRRDSSIRTSALTLQPWREELRHIVNGKVRWYDCMSRPEPQPDGTVVWDGIMLEITDRKRAEEAAETLARFPSQNPNPAFSVAMDGFVLYANEASKLLLSTWGCSCGELVPPMWRRIVHDALTSGVRSSAEATCPGRVFSLTFAPVPEGRYVNVYGYDVTEQKRVEEELRRSEEKLRSIFSVVPAGIGFVVNRVVMECNDYFCEMAGYRREEVLGKSARLFYPSDEEFVRVASEGYTVAAEKGWAHMETQWRRKDGVLLDGLLGLAPIDPRDLSKGVAFLSLDITDRKRAERGLRLSEEKMRSIFSAAPTGIGVVVNRVFTECNDHLCEMTGYSSDELVGRSVRVLYPSQEEFERVGLVKYGMIAERRSSSVETRWRRKDGEEVDVLLSAAPIDASDLSKGVTIAALDITERKRAEKEREKLESQLFQAQKIESVGRLAGGVAHDFNNMLSVILGYAELLRANLSSENPMSHDVDEIARAARRSRDITRQLLAFSRKQIISPKPVQLNELIEGTRTTLSRLIGEDIDLRFSPGENLWKIRFDPTQIDQILINLAVNARDAMPEGGVLTIETQNVDIDESFARSQIEMLPGQYVLLAVSDKGTGMDRETLSHLFEPFFTTKEMGKGTGLGLATIYGIVKQNGGFINVFSEPEKGTAFRIYLPRISGEEAAVEKTEEILIPTGSASILLVEDDKMVRDLTRKMLETIGYAVLVAGTPAEALALLENRDVSIDLLMTDVVMPGANGADLRRNAEAIRPGVRVLFMSGYTSNVIVQHGVLEEGVHFVQKPFTRRDLARKIHEVLSRR